MHVKVEETALENEETSEDESRADTNNLIGPEQEPLEVKQEWTENKVMEIKEEVEDEYLTVTDYLMEQDPLEVAATPERKERIEEEGICIKDERA